MLWFRVCSLTSVYFDVFFVVFRLHPPCLGVISLSLVCVWGGFIEFGVLCFAFIEFGVFSCVINEFGLNSMCLVVRLLLLFASLV